LTSTNKVLKEQIILHFVNEGNFDEDCLKLVTPHVDASQAEMMLKEKEMTLRLNNEKETKLKEIELGNKLKEIELNNLKEKEIKEIE
jgi:hypothetical protein